MVMVNANNIARPSRTSGCEQANGRWALRREDSSNDALDRRVESDIPVPGVGHRRRVARLWNRATSQSKTGVGRFN